MSTPLTKLSDADLERVNHLIRRDATPDLAIAADVEKCIGEKIGPTDAARSMVISRYRKSKPYLKWLTRVETHKADLEKSLAVNNENVKMVMELLQDGNGDGLVRLSESTLARSLTLAALTPNDELKEAMAGKGWIKNAVGLANAATRDTYRRKAEDLKREIEKMLNAPKSSNIKTADVIAKVDDIMGLREEKRPQTLDFRPETK